jgi:hypothetical protein
VANDEDTWLLLGCLEALIIMKQLRRPADVAHVKVASDVELEVKIIILRPKQLELYLANQALQIKHVDGQRGQQIPIIQIEEAQKAQESLVKVLLEMSRWQK